MNAMEHRQYEMLVRIRDFGTTYGHLFPEASVAKENFVAVEAAIKELDAQEVVHSAASVAGRAQRKSTARQALADRLNALAQTARVIREGDSNLLQQFEVPAPATDQTLITTGRKFARDAEPLSSQFIAHGMPATFVADLTALVDGFESALRDRGLGREARQAARLSTKAAVASGIDAVRRLDAVVTNHLANDAVTTAVWERERRILYPKRTNVVSTVTPETTPTPEPTVAPAPRATPVPSAPMPDSPTSTKAA